MHAAHQRQSALAASEAIAGQLDAMVPLAQLPEGAQPQDFPRPARGTERRVSVCVRVCASVWGERDGKQGGYLPHVAGLGGANTSQASKSGRHHLLNGILLPSPNCALPLLGPGQPGPRPDAGRGACRHPVVGPPEGPEPRGGAAGAAG